ncbi:ABC transporter ATP-binding protein [Cytophagaceae bacterium ABcell3]|nr:ABC transporter ATP-binding protein [Cytophagaceae bacterium ABcell3]
MKRYRDYPDKKRASLSAVKYAFKNIIWPRRYLLLLGLVLIIINRLSGLVLPGSTKILIDDILPAQEVHQLYALLGVVGGAIAIQSLSSYFLTRVLSVEAQNLIAQLRLKVQKQVLHMPVNFFDNNRSGSLVSRVMDDVEGVRNLVGTGLVQLVGGLLTSVVAFLILLRINASMTLFAVLPMLVFGFISLKAFNYLRPIFRERSKIKAEVTGRLTESLNGIRVIKGFSAENFEINVFSIGVTKLFNNIKKTLTTSSLVTSLSTLLLGMASILIMGVGGNKIMDGQMTVGDFFAFTLYLGFMVAPIVQMGMTGSQLTEAFAGLDRMEDLLKQERENEDPRRNIELPKLEGNIVFDNVSFSYNEGNGKYVLNNISFDAKPGSITALVGSSGSGKSTIAGLVASYLSPQKGMIYADGNDLSKVTLTSYRSQLGVVLQDDFLFEGSIKDNILFASPGASEQQLMEAVDAAYVTEFANGFEHGLDTLIGERGVKLSGGQKQRIAIARALLANPKVLILDEATSSLDAESESFIQKSLMKLMKGRTTFVIAHRLSTIRQADLILVIENGRVFEKGVHEELLEKKGRYYELFTYQSRI